MTETRVDQGGAYALVAHDPPTRVDQAGAYALIDVGAEARVDQAGVYGFVAVTAPTGIRQGGAYVLANGGPCGTRRVQIWTIERTDGVVKRFTSKDTPLTIAGVTYNSCSSLDPSAAENVAQVDSSGTMDLSGAIGPEGIDERDLYAGLYDGAEVDAWLVTWDGSEIPKRLLWGTFGPLEQTDTGFKVELIGAGARLQQTPLVSKLQPGCRWEFGDPVTCRKDVAPLIVTGTVDSALGLRQFTDGARGETPGYFRRGRVTFTSGPNAGVSAEIKDHEAGGVITLWPKVPFPILPGVTYAMRPGCTNIKASDGGCNGCTAWGNELRYGGHDKVPGGDARSKVAVQKAPD